MTYDAIQKGLKKATPFIFSALAMVGVCVTGYLSAKCASREFPDDFEEMDIPEKAKTVAKTYAPAVTAGALTIGCIAATDISFVAKSNRLRAELLGLCAIGQDRFRAYKDQVKKEFGEEAHAKILQKIEPNIEEARHVIPTTECFFQTCALDFGVDEEERTFLLSSASLPAGNHYFVSTIGRVFQALYYLNRTYAAGEEVTVRELFDLLGLDPPEGLDELEKEGPLGWGYDLLEDNIFWIDWNCYSITTDDGFECCVIEPAIEPIVLNWEVKNVQ